MSEGHYGGPNPFLLVGLLLVGMGLAALVVLAVVLPINIQLPTVQPASLNSSITPVNVEILAGSALNKSSPGYSPDTITVVLGVNSTVIWTNGDTIAHTVTDVNGTFGSGNMNPGATFTWNFTSPGVYNYTCSYHYWMHGRVIVKPGVQGVTVIIPQGASNAPPSWSPTQGHVVSNTYYSPSTITVVIGVNNTVTWINRDAVAHTVTSVNGTFSSGNIAPGQIWTYTFTKPGTYEYFCTYHLWMGGEVIVKSG